MDGMNVARGRTNTSVGDELVLSGYQNAFGFLVRLLYQIVLALFHEVAAGIDITPVQYATLQAIYDTPDNDQRLIGSLIAVDRSTINAVSLRLEQKGMIVRHHIGGRRVHLELTDAGRAILVEMAKVIPGHAKRMLAPLPPEQREQFIEMLKTVIQANNDMSRVPLRGHAISVNEPKTPARGRSRKA
jgi:DNA-binding MarR family transcriptional regulator